MNRPGCRILSRGAIHWNISILYPAAASIQIFLGGDRGAEGVGCGCPPPHWGRGLGGGTAPSPEMFLILDLKIANCGAFLVPFFAVQLKV